MEKRKSVPKNPTICWKCKNAVPTATCGCSWSRSFVPVDGWIAEKHNVKQSNGRDGVYDTYRVIRCPEFQKDDCGTADMCKSDEGCVRLVENILRGQMDRYRAALERYSRTGDKKDLAQFRAIERDLLSPHYEALTMHSVDMLGVCNTMREKVGIPRLEEEV